ncbi:MAG: hypothetical protein ACR2HF_07225 [Methylococcaceae bacterium]
MARKSNHKKKPRPPLVLATIGKKTIARQVPEPLSGIPWKARIAACCGLGVILALFVWVEHTLDTLEAGLKPIHHTSNPRLQAINEQMESLHGRFSLLLAESVEMKLKALSKDMETGRLDPDDARLFNELEKELLLLEQYSNNGAADPLESSKLEHPRFNAIAPIPAPTSAVTSDQELSQQISRLRNFVYFSLSALAIGLLVLVGRWFKPHRSLPDHTPQKTIACLPKPDNHTV